ncbi:glycosyltransferase family 10 [Hydrogenovibrio sp. 3SP14C1]|uniref:glycosyltransferase family 10 domain-containing protein n=1 Tax=Hydrogenovibrio sp. 3SP14C1 TaxID=3038774 RepID=UPI0024167EDA|nr:glycosyltransferase family 10 [Hydrogenovibrio sp. 3SP14C1]MDG4812243.1 glycosyltransferase family 10 [Hydrogenovibrio sp. 3SP14C1]
MIKASIVVPNAYQANRLFDLHNAVLNRDNCLYPFYLLKAKLLEKGYDLATSDIHPSSNSDIVFYNEMPKQLPPITEHAKSYLLLFESELIRPDNWDTEKHKAFNKVFTWNDDLIDNVKYFKMNFSFIIPKRISKDLSKKEKLCTLIAGNKKVNHSLELYSKRVEIIQWFEANHLDQFDLYGIGWDSYHFSGPKLIRALNKIKPLTRLLAPVFPSYRGKVEQKKPVLEKYKFAICFENARDISGYITEKIFDCFVAGCVPVYWGADNIDNHIPNSCYIDMRNFPNYESLYSFLINMSDHEYENYLNEIELFLASEKAERFSADYFVRTLIDQTLIK